MATAPVQQKPVQKPVSVAVKSSEQDTPQEVVIESQVEQAPELDQVTFTDVLDDEPEVIEIVSEVDPEDIHKEWLVDAVADGWIYGSEYDQDAKTSPWIRNFKALSSDEKLAFQIAVQSR